MNGVCAKCHGMTGEGGIGPRIAGSPDARRTRRRSRPSCGTAARTTDASRSARVGASEQVARAGQLPEGEPAQWQPGLSATSAPGSAARSASWLVTTDHKRIGILYISTALVFFVLARAHGARLPLAARAGERESS